MQQIVAAAAVINQVSIQTIPPTAAMPENEN
jgi:hypothetical protein